VRGGAQIEGAGGGERPVMRAAPDAPIPARATTLFRRAWRVRDVDTFE
jgi:hypothetical protein